MKETSTSGGTLYTTGRHFSPLLIVLVQMNTRFFEVFGGQGGGGVVKELTLSRDLPMTYPRK